MFAKILIITTFCVAVSLQSAVRSCGEGIEVPAALVIPHCNDKHCKLPRNELAEMTYEVKLAGPTKSLYTVAELHVTIPALNFENTYKMNVAEHSVFHTNDLTSLQAGQYVKYSMKMPISEHAVANELFEVKIITSDDLGRTLSCFMVNAMVVENSVLL